ncbi:alpha/beta fold hydrolase [Puerhibacterium puerhi]|uniref:alpha/beta fold hydrolase n=1 Tax=Puerhibacterium puerhi TaxID=2692623 RepID=UPI00135B6B3F|nr:alpha/beta hydrolase [Puerhibacterium puerhi]
MPPRTYYARNDGLYIAYQVVGSGDACIVQSFAGPTHLEALWDLPELAGGVEQLARVARVIIYDKRGAGLSDHQGSPVTLEERAADLLAVMDAADAPRAMLTGAADGAAASLVAAALAPDRVTGMVVTEIMATLTARPGHPWGLTEAASRMLTQSRWGEADVLSYLGLAADPRLSEL